MHVALPPTTHEHHSNARGCSPVRRSWFGGGALCASVQGRRPHHMTNSAGATAPPYDKTVCVTAYGLGV